MCDYPRCRVPAEAGHDKCILHLESPKDIDRFKEVFYRQIDESGAEDTQNSRFSFKGYRFPRGIRMGSLEERNTSQNLILPEKIGGDADFSEAEIGGDADFSEAEIGGDADFNGATIKGSAILTGAQVTGFVRFCEAKVDGDLKFFGVRSGGASVDFSKATIEGDVDFSMARIQGNVSFALATLGGDAQFAHAAIGGHVNFQLATIKGAVGFGGAAIERDALFERASAASVFLGFGFPKLRGWHLQEARCGIRLASDQRASSFWGFAQECFSKTRERQAADASFYFERVWRFKELRRRKAWLGTRRGFRTFALRAGYSILWLLDCLLLRWTTAYGASIARLFTTWFVVISGFGIGFSLNPYLIGQARAPVGALRTWITGLHYSVTAFATLGLGHLNPGSSQLGMVLTSIEALLGAVLIALAVLVLGRRFMRQG